MKTYIATKIVQAEPQPRQFDIHKSKVGDPGYKIIYEDGYTSWCPKQQFEDANREADGMPFGVAMEAMQKGYKCFRWGWNGNGMLCQAQFPDEHSKMTHPYLYLLPECKGGIRLLPWQPAQVDIFADDWVIFNHTVEDRS